MRLGSRCGRTDLSPRRPLRWRCALLWVGERRRGIGRVRVRCEVQAILYVLETCCMSMLCFGALLLFCCGAHLDDLPIAGRAGARHLCDSRLRRHKAENATSKRRSQLRDSVVDSWDGRPSSDGTAEAGSAAWTANGSWTGGAEPAAAYRAARAGRNSSKDVCPADGG